MPTVFDADMKTLGDIASDTRRLAEKVRNQRIMPIDLEGGTFTVSNLGMFGISAVTPILNAPQAAILGVGGIRHLPFRVDYGTLGTRQAITLTLSCDQRILYGTDASLFLMDIKQNLEHPERLGTDVRSSES